MSDQGHEVRFLRVVGRRSHQPVVLASVDGHLVRWRPVEGWTCRCDDQDCQHPDAVAALLDDRVLGGLG